MQSVDISDVIARIKSKDGFIAMFQMNGFLVIDKEFLSWEYMLQVVSSQKQLVRLSDVGIFETPPRFFNQDKRNECQDHMGQP